MHKFHVAHGWVLYSLSTSYVPHAHHRSCNLKGVNVMMDPKAMFPDMHHPVALNKTQDFTRDAKFRSRTEAGSSLKYYWVNFQLSQLQPSERTVMKQPEGTSASGDLYTKDVRDLGMMIHENFLSVSSYLSLLQGLADENVLRKRIAWTLCGPSLQA